MVAREAADNKIAALEDPGYVVRCLILDACKQFYRDNSCEAKVIYVTPGMAALLEAHMRREGTDQPIEEWQTVLGMEPVFNALSFELATDKSKILETIGCSHAIH